MIATEVRIYFSGSNTDISPFQHINYTTLRFLAEVVAICDDVFPKYD